MNAWSREENAEKLQPEARSRYGERLTGVSMDSSHPRVLLDPAALQGVDASQGVTWISRPKTFEGHVAAREAKKAEAASQGVILDSGIGIFPFSGTPRK